MTFPLGKCEGQQQYDSNHWELSKNIPRIPCRNCDEDSRESHGGLSGFTIDSNWKTNMRNIRIKPNTNSPCSGCGRNRKSWLTTNSPSLKTPLTVKDSRVFCLNKTNKIKTYSLFRQRRLMTCWQNKHDLTVKVFTSTLNEAMSCWVLGNSLMKATTFSRVCFRSRNRIAKRRNEIRKEEKKNQKIRRNLK